MTDSDQPKIQIKESNDSVEVSSKFDPETSILTSSHKDTITYDKNEVLFDPHELPRLHAAVYSTDRRLQLAAMCHFRKLLSIPENPPISEVIRSGVIPRFIHFLQLKEDPALQFEALWSLTNITSGTSEQTKVVVRAGAVPYFVELLSSENHNVRSQATWGLSNITADSIAHRDLVLDTHALEPLLKCVDTARRLSVIRTTTWAISNLCRGKPSPHFSKVEAALPVLSRLIHSTDDEVLTDACWALSHISDGSLESIQPIIDANTVPRLVQLLMYHSDDVVIPALDSIDRVVSGNVTQAQVVVNAYGVPALVNLLHSPKQTIRKDACHALSNITAGSSAQIQYVLDAGAAETLVGIISSDVFDIRCEAAWVLANACYCGNDSQVHEIVQQNFIAALIDLLSPHDLQLALSLLDALESILRAGSQLNENPLANDNPYAFQVERAGGIDKLEELARCKNETITKKARHILFVSFDRTVDDEYTPVNGLDGDPTIEGNAGSEI